MSGKNNENDYERKQKNHLKSFSRFVLNSSEDTPRSISAARGTLCVESADPGLGLVQPAGEL